MPVMNAPVPRGRGRPRNEESPASVEDILAAALRSFATHGYDGVSVRTLNRELGVSHSLINARFGSKEELWYAAVDWGYGSMATTVTSAVDPTLTDPLEQLRLIIRAFLLHSAEHPELLGLMNIEAQQDSERLAYIFNTYIEPALAPVARLLDHLAKEGRVRPISLRDFHFLVAHGGAAPFSLVPLARHFDAADPLDPAAVREHADFIADVIVCALEHERAPVTRSHRPRG
jgi:AcrR family transcriptional regulator